MNKNSYNDNFFRCGDQKKKEINISEKTFFHFLQTSQDLAISRSRSAEDDKKMY